MASIEIKDNINKWLDVIKEKHAEKGLVRHRVLFEVNGLQLKLTNSSNFENEGKLWVCPVCAAAHGITEDDLVEGAEIAGAARTIGFVSDGAKILM